MQHNLLLVGYNVSRGKNESLQGNGMNEQSNCESCEVGLIFWLVAEIK